jgi:hypothetical protein
MPVGHWSNGPDRLAVKTGVLWSFPNQEVAKPLSSRIRPMVALSFGMTLL